MDAEDRDEILRRLVAIEQRLAQQELRLETLERATPLARIRTLQTEPLTEAPPPPIAVPPAPAGNVVPPAPAAPSMPPASAPDAEYQIGAQILPRVGGFVVIVGLAYLVSLAVGRGWITPTMLWWGANGLAALFVAIGQWKREEREQFGSILTAVGSCGLYLNFAAGHVFQKLYPGETLVKQFVVLSLINLGYALWRSTRVFLVLGVVGGLIAALMPLDKQSYELSVALTFLIIVPATLISARNRWTGIAAFLWVAATFALCPILYDGRVSVDLRVYSILAAGAITATGLGWCFDREAQDANVVILPTLITALMGFLVRSDQRGAEALAGYAAACAIGAAMLKGRAQGGMLTSAAISLLTIAPFGFRNIPPHAPIGATVWILLAISAALAIASIGLRRAAVPYFAAFEYFVAISVLVVLASMGVPPGAETVVLFAFLGALALNVYALSKVENQTDLGRSAFECAAASVAGLLITRLGFLQLSSSSVHWHGEAAAAVSAALVSFVVSLSQVRLRIPGLIWVAWLFALSGGAFYLDASGDLKWMEDTCACAALIAAFVSVAAVHWPNTKERTSLLVVVTVTVWTLISRLGVLLLSEIGPKMRFNAAISTTWVTYVLVLLALGFALKERGMRLMSFAILGLTVGKVFLIDLADLDAGIRVAVLLFLGLAMLGGGYWYIRTQSPAPDRSQG